MKEEPSSSAKQENSIISNIFTSNADLAAVLLSTLVVIALMFLPYLDVSIFREVLSLVIVIFNPGYALTAALFPRKNDLSNVERITLAFGLSIAIVPLLVFVLAYSSPPTLGPVAGVLTLIIISCSVIGLERRRHLTLDDRFSVEWRGLRSAIQQFSKKQGNARLKAVALAICLLIIPLVLYFKTSPTIVNSPITDLLFVALLSSVAVLLVYGSFLIRKPLDVYLLLPQTLMIAFIVRAAPNLKLPDTFLQDPYFHMTTATNVLNFGVANPQLWPWYTNIELQLHWPVMHLLTATTVLTSGIDVGLVFRFQEPLLGALFVLAAFILAKLVIKSDGGALLSAIIVLGSETTIFYQSEYHPQGLAFVLFVFLIYAFLKVRVTKNRQMYGVFLIFLVAFVLSHNFSSLFIGLFAIIVVVMPFALMRVPRIRPEFRKSLKEVSRDYRIWLLIIVPGLLYQVLGSFAFIYQITPMITAAAHTPAVLTVGVQVPLLYTTSNAVQYIFLLLAAVSLLLTLGTQDVTRVRCAVLTVAFIIVGFVGNYVAALPIDRTIGFYTPFGAIFVAFTVYRIKDHWFLSVNKSLKTGLLIAVICMTLVAGVVNSQVPSVFFKDSGANPFYFSSNDLSSVSRLNTSGTWINQHVDQKSRIAVEFDTLSAVFYYGRHAPYFYAEQGLSDDYIKQVNAGYVVVNPSIPYNTGFNKTAYLNRIDVVYDDGRVNVGKASGQ